MRARSLIASAAFAAVVLAIAVPSGDSATPASGARLWTKRYTFAGSGTDSGNAVAASPDGTKVFVAGSSDGGSATGFDYVTIAYDAATGARSWAKRFNGPGSGTDYVYDVAVSPDGSKVFVTGESYGSTSNGTIYATVAYDAATGAQRWLARYNGPGNAEDQAAGIAVSPDGTKVFVTGESYGGPTTSTDYATVAYDASKGTQLWAKRYDGPANGVDYAKAIALNRDGTKVFVGGATSGATNGFNYGTLAYDASTGAQLWLKRYDGPGHGDDRLRSLTVGPTGTIFVTGDSDGDKTTGQDYATVAYDPSTVTQLWASRFTGPGAASDTAFAVAAGHDGTKVFVTGGSDGGATTHTDYGTVAYDASTGAKLWSRPYNGPGSGYDTAYAIGVDPAGTKVFVTGDSYGGPTADYDGATLAYDAATGAKLWGARYNGPGSSYDGFYGLALTGDGTKVFVTGSSYGSATTGNDAATATHEQ